MTMNENIVAHPSAFVKYFIRSRGLKNTWFERVELPDHSVQTFASLISEPTDVEAWYTMNIWKGDKRSRTAWMGAHGIAIDVDYCPDGIHSPVPDSTKVPIDPASFGANLFHWTPRGFRVIFVFDRPWTGTVEAWQELVKGSEYFVKQALRDHTAFVLDEKVTKDTARLVYAPNARVGGVQRSAEVLVVDREPTTFDSLSTPGVWTLKDIWNARNVHLAEDWPDSNGECPACGHNGCFGRLSNEETKWVCFSANHGTDSGHCGTDSGSVWVGSAIDLEANRQERSVLEVLDSGGYFLKSKTDKTVTAAEEQAIEEDPLFLKMLEDYVLIDGETKVYCVPANRFYTAEALSMAYPKFYKRWLQHPERRFMPMSRIVFKPQGCAPSEINLYRGLDTAPAPGKCEKIVAHVYNMCDYDPALAHHLLCWLAWPLQHPGAKMGYAVVVHGGQGTGKSLFFEHLMMKQIYGLRYGIQIGQTELESSFTGWLSQKLFVVCNEVSGSVAERKHARNRLKSLITDTHFAIDEKYMPLRTEENHANLVFLSNEHQPVLPEMDDRRYEIIRFDRKESADYYDALADEIKDGGSGAFLQYLLNYDTRDYRGTSEKPMVTAAKETLVATSRTAPDQFLAEWRAGDTQYPFVSCGIDDLWLAYRLWCKESGYYPGTKVTFGRTLVLSPFGKDIGLGTTMVDGKNTRYRKIEALDQGSYADQIRLFREEYNNAYVNYRTRTQI